MAVEPLSSTRGIDLPEGLAIEEMFSWGDLIYARCAINGNLIRKDGKWFRQTLTPFTPKKVEPPKQDLPKVADTSLQDSASGTTTPPEGGGSTDPSSASNEEAPQPPGT